MQFPTNKLHLKNIYVQALLLNITGNRSPVFSFFFRAALCFKVGGMNEEEEERVLGALRSSDESPKKKKKKGKIGIMGGGREGGYQKEQGGRGGTQNARDLASLLVRSHLIAPHKINMLFNIFFKKQICFKSWQNLFSSTRLSPYFSSLPFLPLWSTAHTKNQKVRIY